MKSSSLKTIILYLQMMKGKSTTFRITLDPNLETNADFRIQSTDTSVHILEWLVENTKL